MDKTYSVVASILADVRKRGDLALCDFARRFDGIRLAPKNLKVSTKDLRAAHSQVSADFRWAIQTCGRQIESFATAEKARMMKSWMRRQGGVQTGQLVRPVDSVGLYIPGGRFPYPSTVLMTALPARVAGVRRIVMATPPKNLTPEVLAAAHFAGITEIYRMGGAGAIAALAFGTKTVPKVDFIVGPGNQFVMEAKRQVYGLVGIDSLAGPSEVVVIADSSMPVSFLVNDLLAQAEHDPEAKSHLLSPDGKLLKEVRRHLDARIKSRVALERVQNLDRAVERANEIGAEHLELMVKNPERLLPQIRHAGAIFLGRASTAVLGDYVAGPSHVLPTQRSARFSSGLSVATFYKRSSVIGFSGKQAEKPFWKAALTMAATEGMEYHGRSLRARLTHS